MHLNIFIIFLHVPGPHPCNVANNTLRLLAFSDFNTGTLCHSVPICVNLHVAHVSTNALKLGVYINGTESRELGTRTYSLLLYSYLSSANIALILTCTCSVCAGCLISKLCFITSAAKVPPHVLLMVRNLP